MAGFCRNAPVTVSNWKIRRVRAAGQLSDSRETGSSVTRSRFTGTDRGLLRSVLGPWSPVPQCEAPGAPISVEEHTSMAARPRRQSQNPPLQNLPPFTHYRGLQNYVSG